MVAEKAAPPHRDQRNVPAVLARDAGAFGEAQQLGFEADQALVDRVKLLDQAVTIQIGGVSGNEDGFGFPFDDFQFSGSFTFGMDKINLGLLEHGKDFPLSIFEILHPLLDCDFSG